MRNRVRIKRRGSGLVAIAGIGFSMSAGAADLTCSDITFTPEAFAIYEFVDKACLEMVDRGGKTYAKLSALIVAQTRSSTHVRFLNQDGSRGTSHKTELPSDFETMLNGLVVKLEDLAVRQDINIYIPEQYWSGPEVTPDPVGATDLPPAPPPTPEPETEPDSAPGV